MAEPKPSKPAGPAPVPPQLPPMNIIQEMREKQRIGAFRSYYECGFNDFVKDAMTKEDRKTYNESEVWIRRGNKYCFIGGIFLAFVPRWIGKFRMLPWYVKWPVRLGLLATPLVLYYSIPNKRLDESKKTQARLFDKYSAMDPKELEKKLPKVHKTQQDIQSALKGIWQGRVGIPQTTQEYLKVPTKPESAKEVKPELAKEVKPGSAKEVKPEPAKEVKPEPAKK